MWGLARPGWPRLHLLLPLHSSRMITGAQYIAWNASSTLLAVSSDALHAVFVFEPHSGRLMLRVEGHRRPCLWCVGAGS